MYNYSRRAKLNPDRTAETPKPKKLPAAKSTDKPAPKKKGAG